QPQGVAGPALDRAGEEPVDEVVAGPPHAGRAVDEVGDEPAVGRLEARPLERPGEREVGVGAAGVDPVEDVEGDGPGAAPAPGGPPRPPGDRAPAAARPAGPAHRPNPATGPPRTPLAHAAAGIRRRPSGWTSTSHSGPSPVGTSSASRPAGVRDVRHTFSRVPSWVVQAPPTRTTRWITSAGADQSMRSSSGVILCAYVGSPCWGTGSPSPRARLSTSSRAPSSASRARSSSAVSSG